ncbi:hypothetical protein FCE95_14055 [Luteimonas gilva]|uniref:Secreted protein n=1 Tax=Luteimonas gilva TaxID=2572684 RepID=A0A4U5JIE7_9GAMM|nr:hypothetical protein [Luteimonas gilva]TKR29282.1 hypothetical protein FCE95_14055 [Luteimonas gilva]
MKIAFFATMLILGISATSAQAQTRLGKPADQNLFGQLGLQNTSTAPQTTKESWWEDHGIYSIKYVCNDGHCYVEKVCTDGDTTCWCP